MQNSITMQEFVVSMLQEQLPAQYCYHNIHHTQYVQDKAVMIASAAGCTPEEIRLLSAAALWHDSGFINTYANHEEAGVALAKKHLPQFGFTTEEIDLVAGLIMATRLPQLPQTNLQCIIADADLEYLGTPAAPEKSALLYEELHHLNPMLKPQQWLQQQIDFLTAHRYHTPFCKREREPAKQLYLQQLKKQAIK